MRRMLDESHIHENNSFTRFSYNDNSLDILPKFKKRFAEIEPMLSGFRKRIDDSVELNLSVTYWRKMYRQSEDYARAKCPKPILDYFDYTREVDSTAIINRRDIQLFWKRFRKNYDIS
ncbi:MAG: hypothetical protein LBN01_04340 [Endomicrobium sp.]|nr:hypothetical protein [Endomicrobium sp.]